MPHNQIVILFDLASRQLRWNAVAVGNRAEGGSGCTNPAVLKYFALP